MAYTGVVVGNLPTAVRPLEKHAFSMAAVNSNVLYRMNVHPDGEVKVCRPKPCARYNSSLNSHARSQASTTTPAKTVSLEGVFYQLPDADGTSDSWTSLLTTLPVDVQQIFQHGAPQANWAPPSFKRVGDFVLLRGLIEKKAGIVVDPNDEASPLVGRLPLGMRPHFDQGPSPHH